MPSDRPELSSMADDYARYALSQRAAFEATHPSALAAARRFEDERVLRVVDLGAADGVNSYGLIRDLAEAARWPAAGLRARRSADQRVGRRRRAPVALLRRSGERIEGRRDPGAGRRRLRGRRCRHGGPLRLAGGPRRS